MNYAVRLRQLPADFDERRAAYQAALSTLNPKRLPPDQMDSTLRTALDAARLAVRLEVLDATMIETTYASIVISPSVMHDPHSTDWQQRFADLAAQLMTACEQIGNLSAQDEVSRLAQRVARSELHVVLLGASSRGKTTLLNALLGAAYPNPVLTNALELFDSPAIDASLYQERRVSVVDTLAMADAVIVVFDSRLTFVGDERDLVQTTLHDLGYIHSLFFCNRLDQLPVAKRERLVAYWQHQLRPKTIWGTTGIFFGSAREALAGKLDADHQRFAESGVATLEAMLTTWAGAERAYVRLAQPVTRCRALIASIAQATPALPMIDQQLAQLLSAVTPTSVSS